MLETCALCGMPREAGQPVLMVPKALVHSECLQHSGASSPTELVDRVPCCSSREYVVRLGGSFVEKRQGIPPDQVWFVDRDARAIFPFHINPTGIPVLEPLSPIRMSRKKEEPHGGEDPKE